MEDELIAQIKAAVAEWARKTHGTDQVVVGWAAQDDAEDDEADRYLVDFAVRSVGYWLVAEVWVTDNGRILSVNDLGEGIPLDEAEWPWPTEELG
ncbi:MAG: hypothetical protein ACWGPS_00540 [Candidatus Promineifilaceae bacterium]